MPGALTPAYVLHRRRYGDTSLLLEFLTLAEGRIPLVAKGAAAMKSRRRGLLQPFVPLLIDWRGRGSLKTLTVTEAAGSPPSLAGHSLYSGFYLNELIMRLVPRNEALPLLFGHYRSTLEGLAQERPLDEVLRGFELQLLHELGYAPDLERDSGGKPIEPGEHYRYRQEAGFEAVPQQSRGAVSGHTLLALAGGQPLDAVQRRQAKELLRGILAFYLGDRPLKSRELFRTMAPRQGPPKGVS